MDVGTNPRDPAETRSHRPAVAVTRLQATHLSRDVETAHDRAGRA